MSLRKPLNSCPRPVVPQREPARILKMNVSCSKCGGKEELGLGEQDFRASGARPLGAWPHKAPFVEGPCSRPKSANNSAMLLAARPSLPGHTAAA
jgi:hypothetical protein